MHGWVFKIEPNAQLIYKKGEFLEVKRFHVWNQYKYITLF